MPRITITVEGKVPQPYRFGLDRESVTLGRDESNDVMVDCGSVSLHHAVMQRVHGGYELMDKGSTNGIKLDGEYRQVIDLKNGQAVMLGDVVFDFELSEEELVELVREDSSLSPAVDPASVLPPMPKEEPKLPAWPDDDEEEEEDESSEPLKPMANLPAAAPAVVPIVYREGNDSTLNKLVCAFAVVAFLIGMEIHYRKDVGSSMLGRIYENLLGKSAEAPVKDAATGPN